MSGEKGAYHTKVRMSSNGGRNSRPTKKHHFITIREQLIQTKLSVGSTTTEWMFKNIISKYLPTDYLLLDYSRKSGYFTVEIYSTYHLNQVIEMCLPIIGQMDVLFMWYSRNSKTSFIPAGSAYAVFLKNVSEMKDKEMMQNCFRQKEMKELGHRILDVGEGRLPRRTL